jgi:hypothetical protein
MYAISTVVTFICHLTAQTVRIRAVGAGKNHSLCVEDWADGGLNRVFSFGFGGYGRLGHATADDEMYPREINAFQSYVAGKVHRHTPCAPMFANLVNRETRAADTPSLIRSVIMYFLDGISSVVSITSFIRHFRSIATIT